MGVDVPSELGVSNLWQVKSKQGSTSQDGEHVPLLYLAAKLSQPIRSPLALYKLPARRHEICFNVACAC